MKNVLITLLLICAAMGASGQIVEQNSSSSTQRDSSRTTTQSTQINRTYSLGFLFFPLLAEWEQANHQALSGVPMKESDKRRELSKPVLQKFLQSKIEAGLVDDVKKSILITPLDCNVFVPNGRKVWTNHPSGTDIQTLMSVTKPAEYAFHIIPAGKVFAGSFSIEALGFPIMASEYLGCSYLYSIIVSNAINRLASKGKKSGSVFIVSNLMREAEKSLWASFFDVKLYDEQPKRIMSDVLGIPEGSMCTISSARNLIDGGNDDFVCGPWAVSPSNTRIMKAGSTYLDQNSVYGQNWQFSETSTAGRSNTTTKSNSSGTKKGVKVME